MADEAILRKIAELEADIKTMRISGASATTPAWSDVRALEERIKSVSGDLTAIKVALAAPTLQKNDVQQMIDAAWNNHKIVMAKSVTAFINDDRIREEITEKAVEQLREEIRASLGVTASNTVAAKHVARTTIENAIETLRSRSFQFARG
jgi:hypothetical protein